LREKLTSILLILAKG